MAAEDVIARVDREGYEMGTDARRRRIAELLLEPQAATPSETAPPLVPIEEPGIPVDISELQGLLEKGRGRLEEKEEVLTKQAYPGFGMDPTGKIDVVGQAAAEGYEKGTQESRQRIADLLELQRKRKALSGQLPLQHLLKEKEEIELGAAFKPMEVIPEERKAPAARAVPGLVPEGEPGAPPLVPVQPGAQPRGMPGAMGLGGLQEEYRAAAEAGRGGLAAGEEIQRQELERQRGVVAGEQERAKTQATAEFALAEERRVGWEKMQSDQAERAERRQKIMDDDMQLLKQSMGEIRDARIDPYRFYKHPDGSVDYPKRVMAAIAVGLGAYAARGGPNAALQIIQRAIDRDIDAQKHDLATRRGGLALKLNLYGKMQQRFANEPQADAATRLVYLQTAKMKTEEMLAKNKAPEVQAKGAEMLAGINMQEQELGRKFQMATAEKTMETTKEEFEMATKRTQLGLAREGMRRQRQAAEAKAAAPAALAPPVAGFQAFRSVGKDEAKEARKISDNFGGGIRAIKKLIALRNDIGGKLFPAYVDANTGRMEAFRGDLLMMVKEGYQLGALQEHEMIFMEKLIPDTTSFGYVIPQLEALGEQFEERYAAQMYNRGYGMKGKFGEPPTIGEEMEAD